MSLINNCSDFIIAVILQDKDFNKNQNEFAIVSVCNSECKQK